MREFNLRNESDPNYRADVFEVNDDMEALTYQIKMALGTDRGEVLGESEFGCDLDGLLFASEFYMVGFDTVVTDQIAKFSELAQVYPVGVQMTRMPLDEYKSAALLDIKIQGKSVFGVLLGND
jgi:hypothetical protein